MQKTFTVDFLNKTRKKNKGELQQYYIENSHPAIISPETFDLVQSEIRRRRPIRRQLNNNSPFAAKIICGECQGFFGSKVWHSTGKYRNHVWQCIKRFGRNTLDLLQIFQELKMLNIDVYFEIEHLHLCDPNAELILTILASTAQQESEDLSFNIKWGIRHAFRSGTSKLITRPCYGYRKSDDGTTLVIYEPEAKVVRQIFGWKRRGYSLGRISQLLQDGKIPSPTGKTKWGSETLNKLIHNEKYAGNVMLQKTFVGLYVKK